ncbi:MAG: serine/threonine protein kinase [Blautia sp.]|nr:serine/threonine protein kinase [Blautia sp.]
MYTFLKEAIKENYDPYKLLRQTERGRVEVIHHRESGKLYILREYTGSGEAYEILKKIRCANLPVIYECAEEDGRVLVLEEYVRGDNLQDLLLCGPLDVYEVRRIAAQLCNALWVLHNSGLVHRDVKPDNVIMRGDSAILIDFDAARIYTEKKSADTHVLGTVGYASPEQYGFSQTDARSDIYSLGVLMNIMLTGEHPSVKMAGGRMGIIIRRCTMTNSKQRFRNVRQVRDLL